MAEAGKIKALPNIYHRLVIFVNSHANNGDRKGGQVPRFGGRSQLIPKILPVIQDFCRKIIENAHIFLTSIKAIKILYFRLIVIFLCQKTTLIKKKIKIFA
jgi:hypothetical protein